MKESQIGVNIIMGEEGEEKRPRASSQALKMGKASAARMRDLPRAEIAGAGSPNAGTPVSRGRASVLAGMGAKLTWVELGSSAW